MVIVCRASPPDLVSSCLASAISAHLHSYIDTHQTTCACRRLLLHQLCQLSGASTALSSSLSLCSVATLFLEHVNSSHHTRTFGHLHRHLHPFTYIFTHGFIGARVLLIHSTHALQHVACAPAPAVVAVDLPLVRYLRHGHHLALQHLDCASGMGRWHSTACPCRIKRAQNRQRYTLDPGSSEFGSSRLGTRSHSSPCTDHELPGQGQPILHKFLQRRQHHC